MTSEFKFDLVIAYYKENLDWLSNLEDKYKNAINKVYIYCKGGVSPPTTFPHIEIRLPNIGRCDHTYLYHMINQYNNLAPVTVFTTGSTGSIEHKFIKFNLICNHILKTHNSAFNVHHSKIYLHQKYKHLQLDIWKATDNANQESTAANKLSPAKTRPFGKWYAKHFKNLKISHWCPGGVFAVSKKHIHYHSKSYYEDLISEFNNGGSNPEVGHYFERSWIAIFHPIPKTCFINRRETETIKKKYVYRITRKQKKTLP